MGLRRRLSKKWNETVNGVLSGPGVDVDSVNTGQVSTESIPEIRVYTDSDTNETVAVSDSEIARNNSADVTFQAVFDSINALFDATERFEPVAVVNGGFDLFTLENGLDLKEGVKLANCRFEASNVTTEAAIDVGPSDGGTSGATVVRDVVVRNPGAVGVCMHDLSQTTQGPITVSDASGFGIELSSCLSNHFIQLHSRGATDPNIALRSNGATGFDCNLNLFSAPTAHSGAKDGINAAYDNVDSDGNLFLNASCENNAGIGFRVPAGNANVLFRPRFESNGSRGCLIEGGASHQIYHPIAFDNEGGGGGNQGIRIAGGSELRVVGPIEGNDLVAVASGTDNRLRNVADDDILADNATRTRINDTGEESANAETPTNANWSTGDVVEFTDSGDGSGNGIYVLLKDRTWSQIGT